MKSSENIADLYTRIPDYSEVKHLGNSDFINTLERLKEEFRVCRASLNDVSTDDIDFISSQTSKVLNISSDGQRRNQNQNLYSSTSLFLLEKDSAKKTINNKMNNQAKKDLNVDKVNTKGMNPNNYYSHNSSNNIFHLTPTNNMYSNNKTRRESSAISSSSFYSYSQPQQQQKSQDMNLDSNYLSISASSMAIHKNPNDPFMMSGHSRQRSASMSAGRQQRTETLQSPPFSQQRRCLSTDKYQTESRTNRDWDESAYAEDFELCSSDDEGDGSTPDSAGLSHWSSSPEIYNTKEKEFCPPSNIEKRLLIRRAQNNSAPSIPAIEEEPKSLGFKAHPVPSHVHKPLFDYIMLKNKRRSMRVREQSKQKLLAQVKPFSFSSDSRIPKCSSGHHGSQTHYHQQQYSVRPEELLNNSRPTKSSSARRHQNGIKTNNNKFHNSHHQFKANPAPPRTKALLSAIRLKEQQEYRELKKRLRAEALLKTAQLPPSMAARDRRTKANLVRLDNLLNRFNSSSPLLSRGRRYRESSSDTFTDEDRLTTDPDDFYLLGLHMDNSNSRCNSNNSTRKGKSRGGNGKTLKNSNDPNGAHSCSRRHGRRGNFTPYGELRFPTNTTATGVFEATSNDNHASKLRIQVAKAKELERLQKEEEDLLRSMKMDKKRQKLRDYHYQAWKRAGSYSSAQDIAMRRQLRMASAILERESYKKEMSTMLMRVRSAPLLLEGLRERKFEPCRKHRQEGTSTGLASEKTPRNKLSSPRRNNNYNTSFSRSFFHHHGELAEPEKSETAAFAEGSLTNSDNESVKNPELDFDHDEDQDEEDDHLHDEKFVNNSKPQEMIDTMNVKEHDHSQSERESNEHTYNRNGNGNGNGNGSKYNCSTPFIKINNRATDATSEINQILQGIPGQDVLEEEDEEEEEQEQHNNDEEERHTIVYQGNESHQITVESDDVVDRDKNCHSMNDDFEEDIDIFEDF